MERGVVAEIDLGAVAHNLRVIRRLTSNLPVFAVVKADAYGHGAVEVSRLLASEGVGCLAVAFTSEAQELRRAGITAPILVLFGYAAEDVFAWDLIPVVHEKKEAIALSREAVRRGRVVGVHIKVDTGMGRLGIGVSGMDEILDIASLPGIRIDGMMSHFSEADLMDTVFARTQIESFGGLRDRLRERGLSIPLLHMANSAAVISLPQAHFGAVRPGLMLYGYSPLEQAEQRTKKGDFRLVPAMTVKARLLAVRRLPANTPVSYGRTFITKQESLIGVVAMGYADGFSRKFSNNAAFQVRGTPVPVVGRVCMDLTMVDLTGVPDVREGDEVVIMGGGEDASSLALKADTIPYEILTSLGTKARRVYRLNEPGEADRRADSLSGERR